MFGKSHKKLSLDSINIYLTFQICFSSPQKQKGGQNHMDSGRTVQEHRYSSF